MTFSIAGISKLGHIGGFVTGAPRPGWSSAACPQMREADCPTGCRPCGLAGLAVLVLAVVGGSATPPGERNLANAP